MRNVRRLTVFTDRGGLLRIDPRTQERRLPAVHVVLRVAGQLQGAIILVHIPAGTDAGQRHVHTSSPEWLIIHRVIHPNKQAQRISWKELIKSKSKHALESCFLYTMLCHC